MLQPILSGAGVVVRPTQNQVVLKFVENPSREQICNAQ